MDEMKPVVKSDIRRWVRMSKKIFDKSFFRKIWTMRTLMQRTKSTTSHLKAPLQVFFLNWALDGGIRIYSGWGILMWKIREMKKSGTSLKIRTVRKLIQGTQIENLSIENLFTTWILYFFVPTLTVEIKPVISIENEFEKGEKLKMECFLLKFRTIKIVIKDRKTTSF